MKIFVSLALPPTQHPFQLDQPLMLWVGLPMQLAPGRASAAAASAAPAPACTAAAGAAHRPIVRGGGHKSALQLEMKLHFKRSGWERMSA